MKTIATFSFAGLVAPPAACGGPSEGGPSADPSSTNPGATDSGTPSPAGCNGVLPCALDRYVWAEPPPADDVKSNAKPIELTAKDASQNESVFQCTSYDHDAHGVYDHVVSLSQESAAVKPG